MVPSDGGPARRSTPSLSLRHHPGIPEPLKEQLAPGGRMVIPVGMGETQQLVLVEREGDNFRETVMADVRFVPLLGRHGF
jgi:protein-L-isoaspartate(D-aspartate) O-methyltransferase